MILTPENYHSPEANLAYMSVSQYKEWLKCEAATLATLRGEYEPEDKEALIVGGYLHAYFESPAAFAAYCEKYRDFILKPKGGKYAAFVKADEMIETLNADPKAMFYLEGLHEVIITPELWGVPWKFKIDVLNQSRNYLLELKTTASIREVVWVEKDGKRQPCNFVEGWGYLLQAALYAEGEWLHAGRGVREISEGVTIPDWRDVLCMAVSKETPCDHELIRLFDPDRFRAELAAVEAKLPRIVAVKTGQEPPQRCGICKYCRQSKKITVPVYWANLMPA